MIASAIVWRIVWKELRQLAPVWAVILVVSAFVLFSLRQFTEAPIALGLALAFLTAFGGCLTALMLFAMEHDNQTVRFLQNLPQTRRLVVATKIILGLVGTVVLYFCIACVDLVTDENFRDFGWNLHSTLMGREWQEIALFMGLWGFLIACLTSAVIKRSLPAGLVAMALLGLLVASLGGWWWDNLLFWEQGERLTTFSLLANLIGLTLLFGASLVVGRGWLDSEVKEESGNLFSLFSRRKKVLDEFDSAEASALRPGRAGKRTKLWTVLAWQTLRQSRLSMAIFLVAGIGIAIALQFVKPFSHYYLFTYAYFFGPLLALASLSLLGGTLAFWPDQARDTKRFFWQHSLNGRTIWWVRLVPWLAVVFVLTVVFAFANQQFFRQVTEMAMLQEQLSPDKITSAMFGKLSPEILTVLAAYWRPGSHLLFFGLIALGVGQFFSLLFRNGLVALSCSIIVGPLAIYYVAHVVSKGEQAIWFAAPWGLCWFLASWYLAKSWIDGTLTWRGRTGAIAFLLTAFIAQFAAFAYHRAFEYPKTDWLEQVKSEAANGDAFFEVGSSLDKSVQAVLSDIRGKNGLSKSTIILSKDHVEKLYAANVDHLERLQQLITGSMLIPKDPTISVASWERACSSVQMFLEWKAELHLQKGDLAESLSCYINILQIQAFNPNSTTSDTYMRTCSNLLHWAEHPQQTNELIDKAIEILGRADGGTLSAYYLASAKERLRDDRKKANRISWWNPLSQPWEEERHHQLGQLDLCAFHRLSNNRVASTDNENNKVQFLDGSAKVDNLARIKLREFSLTRPGKITIEAYSKDLLRQNTTLYVQKAVQTFPLDFWQIAADSSNRFLTLDPSEFDRLNNPNTSRNVNLGYLMLRFQFQKFWLTNKRFPTTEEGMNILFEYSGTPSWYQVPYEYSFYEIHVQNEGSVYSVHPVISWVC
ncbi:MAG: hypothetical protein ABL888_21285 [Pirellulaceae bacterium]